jgi:hypothetical protein
LGHPFRILTAKLESVEGKLDLVIEVLRLQSQTTHHLRNGIDESNIIFSLPAHLQLTYFELQRKGHASALDVSTMTGRVRASESMCLNQLWRLGWVQKNRIGRKTVFSMVKA